MAEPIYRNGSCPTAKTPMRIVDQGIRAVSIFVMAVSLANGAYAQTLPELLPSQQERVPRPGTATPTYPLVKPVLPPPGLGVGQPPQPLQSPQFGYPSLVTIRMRESKTHPNGMTILVDTVSFLPSSIVIAVQIFNPAVGRRRLNPFGSLQLTDDRGRSYLFLPPPNNPDMLIEPQSRVIGRLVFVGGVDWQARFLRLSINHPLGSSTDRMTATPLFQFSLPVDLRS